jgi:hypothetical protein
VKLREKWIHQPDVNFGASAKASSGSAQLSRGIAYHRKVYKTLKLQREVSMLGGELLIEPWFRSVPNAAVNYERRSPDAVWLFKDEGFAIVIEVKMNWADGRDIKLLDEYLPIVRSAFELEKTYPLMIVGNVRGYAGSPYLSMPAITELQKYSSADITPILLMLGK